MLKNGAECREWIDAFHLRILTAIVVRSKLFIILCGFYAEKKRKFIKLNMLMYTLKAVE